MNELAELSHCNGPRYLPFHTKLHQEAPIIPIDSAPQGFHEGESARAAAGACNVGCCPEETVRLGLEAHLLCPYLTPHKIHLRHTANESSQWITDALDLILWRTR